MGPEELFQRIAVYIPKTIAVLPMVAGIVVAAFLINIVIGRLFKIIAASTSLTELDLLPFRRLSRWIVHIIALVLILGVFGFEISGIWAMVSTVLGLVAIGFVAVWSLLSNISSTLLILLLRPFQIGDDIELADDSVQGRVIDLNFFFITLLNHEGKFFQIPTNLFFQKAIKRKQNAYIVSLSHQINSPVPAQLPRPPAPTSAIAIKQEEPNSSIPFSHPRATSLPGCQSTTKS